jgi:Tfp pilus assembly protein PilO
MENPGRKPSFQGRLINRLYDPLQLRVFLTGTVLVAGYLAIYSPLSDRIEASSRQLTAETKRLDLAREIEHLRSQFAKFKDRIPEKSDAKEWVQYVLDGMRRFPLKLVTLDSEPLKEVGPYKAVSLRIELEGSFPDMNGFLEWLETNDRLFRIDQVRIQPHRSGNGAMVMQLNVLGVMG